MRSLPSSRLPGRKFIAGEPMKPATNRFAGWSYRCCGDADLLHHAAAHDHDPVAERHRLGLVVGHVDRGGAQPLLEPGDLGAHLHAQLGVEVGQRLVHQERLRVADDGPAHRDPLALAAGEVGRLAVEVLGQVEDAGGLVDLLVDDGLGRLGQLERETHVLAHGHVRVQGVALEDHGDVAVLRRLVVDDLAVDAQLALGDVLQPGDHVEGGRLPAAGRADQDDELAVGDVEVDVVHRQRTVREALGDVVQNDLGHGLLLKSPASRLALDGAGGQPGDDAPLEEQHEDDDGDGDDHRGGGDRPGGLLEL